MKPYYRSKWISIVQGDSLDSLRRMASGTVQCCVTSPPYWGLRDYGVPGQMGLEATPEAYVARMVELFREVRRVLQDDGTLWLNLGDSYAGGGGFSAGAPSSTTSKSGKYGVLGALKTGGIKPQGFLKAKDLVGIPWRVAFALQADGWYLRSDIIWHKPNPMPESVTDRPTKSHEYIFLLAKSGRYFYDAAAIKEPHASIRSFRGIEAKSKIRGCIGNTNLYAAGGCGYGQPTAGRNRRSVWTVSTKPFKGAHFATFPPKLIEPCILAGSRPGDTVLDPFSGAATTGVVARQLARKYVGIELNSDYIEISRQRLSASA